MEELRADYTEVWVPSAVIPLVQFADRVRSIAATGIDTFGIPGLAPAASLLSSLRSFDSIISWYGSNREEFAEACHAWGLQVEFRTAIPPASVDVHAVDFFLQRTSDRYPHIRTSAVSTSEYIAVHPFSGSTHKNWPLDRFRALEAMMPLPMRYCVGPHQTLAGATEYASLYDLACWIRGARLYIGNDSGITHLAAATGVSTVALFGHSKARVWAPRGRHVRIVEAPSVADIDVPSVVRAAREFPG